MKTFVAGKIKQALNVRMLLRVRYVSGALLIVFGLYLIYKVFFFIDEFIQKNKPRGFVGIVVGMRVVLAFYFFNFCRV
ncbi:hypothetical protein ACHM19_15405, partial [Clostridium perfringens]